MRCACCIPHTHCTTSQSVPRCIQERSPSPLAKPARAAAQAHMATPPPLLHAASPPISLSSRWSVLADLERADNLAMQPQDSIELGGAGAQDDAVQEALSALKLGVLPLCVSGFFVHVKASQCLADVALLCATVARMWQYSYIQQLCCFCPA